MPWSTVSSGYLTGCFLSSSASVLLTYLLAFARVNHIQLQPWDYVRLTRRAENKYIGLNNGILDQTSIVFGRRSHLLHIDTKAETVRELPDALEESHYRILVAYSGYSRELTTTGYNSRVQECREAAAQLDRLVGLEAVQTLSDISQETFERHGHQLAPHLGRRAEHYFTEVQRVHQGLDAWQKGTNAAARPSMTYSRSSVPQTGYTVRVTAAEDSADVSSVL